MNQAAEARVGSDPLEVFVAARVDAVFGTQDESRFEMSECHVHIPSEGMRYRQSVLDVILMGFKLVGLFQMLDCLLEVAYIQTRNTQRIVFVG